MTRRGFLMAALAICALPLGAQDLKEFEKRVTAFTLANGLHFIVLQRPQAPVISFHTYVNAGSLDDPKGETGLAHMFEHMAFKGTETIGTKSHSAEKEALEEVEQIYDRLEQEQRKGQRADKKQIQALQERLEAAIKRANEYVVPNEFPRVIEENGGVGLNASTGLDATNYFYNLPANRLELWFLLESQRFLRPVFREFYKERDVVREERRMRTESSPQGKLIEMLLAEAFVAHPYHEPPVGWASDIENLRVEHAEQFFKTYYTPGNITIGIAGDVDPARVKRLAEKYFGRIKEGPLPPPVNTVEPPQEGERRVEVVTPAQPLAIIAYKRPNQNHADDAAFDVLSGILASGRTGMLYKELVRDKRIAVAAQSIATFPGGKYPNLFIFFMVPSVGHTIQENEKAVYDIVERLKKEKVDETTLDRVKTKVRASVIRQLDSNAGMATQLAWYHVNYGNWRMLFQAIDEIAKVTADDVQRLARTYFVESARTVAFTVQPKKAGEGK